MLVGGGRCATHGRHASGGGGGCCAVCCQTLGLVHACGCLHTHTHTHPLFCKCDNLSVNFAFPIPRKSQVHACGKPFCRRSSSHHPSCYSLPSKPTPAVAGACGAAAAVGRGSNAAARCKASCLRRLFSACLRCTCATCRKPSQCGCPCPASLRYLPISSHVAVSRTPVDIAEADA